MGEVLFYHLTRSRPADALAALLPRALDRGWRVAVRGTREEALDALDAALWLGPEERFLPHGRAGGPHDARQPVLLTTAADMPNGATCVMAIDGAEVAPEEAARLARVCILFDGGDDGQVVRARGQWTAVTAAGLVAQYWSEESGRWALVRASAG